MNAEEKILWAELKNRNHKVFDALFREYYPVLVKFAESFLFDREMSEDLVQSFFVALWENSPCLDLHNSLRQYFFQSIKNSCLNKLRDSRVRDNRQLLYIEAVLRQYDDNPRLIDPEMIVRVKESINKLPTQMSLIFKLKYLERKKNHEISQLLNVSENTIKTQLSRAKTKIRSMMK